MSSTSESVSPSARVRARPPSWPPWRLPSLARDLEAWNAQVRRSIDAYDEDRELERYAVAHRRHERRARDARLRQANQLAVEYRNERRREAKP